MNIFISSDHGGFELKKVILNSGIALMTDMGPYEYMPEDDYPLYAFPLAEKIVETNSLGILICKSGNGMAIAANKVKGARAALGFTPAHATKAKEDDDANILVLDSLYTTSDHLEILTAFLDAKFAGGRHQRRIDLIAEYERSSIITGQKDD